MNEKTRGLIQRLTLTPYSVWAALFIVVPLIFVAYYAFTDASFQFTTENVTRFFTATSVVDDGEAVREVHTYLLIFMRSLKLARYLDAYMPPDGLPHRLYNGRAPRHGRRR